MKNNNIKKQVFEPKISPSMNVNTRPAHRFEINGYWVLVDPKMPENEFENIKQQLTTSPYVVRN
jgi:hypothetical protein